MSVEGFGKTTGSDETELGCKVFMQNLSEMTKLWILVFAVKCLSVV